MGRDRGLAARLNRQRILSSALYRAVKSEIAAPQKLPKRKKHQKATPNFGFG
jgi:hypothetical protein